MQGKLLGVHTDIAPSGDVFWSRHISASFVGHFAFQAYPFGASCCALPTLTIISACLLFFIAECNVVP